ncbi:MAG: hypothetical protein H6737_14830 [Alphaproteobacteria bacterium]|nr:hypothetical protein [Alphaproteobacteria bacterium]
MLPRAEELDVAADGGVRLAAELAGEAQILGVELPPPVAVALAGAAAVPRERAVVLEVEIDGATELVGVAEGRADEVTSACRSSAVGRGFSAKVAVSPVNGSVQSASNRRLPSDGAVSRAKRTSADACRAPACPMRIPAEGPV